jgi:hypothetical protein
MSQGDVVTKIENTHYILNDEFELPLPFTFQDDYELIPDKFDITTLVPFESRVLVRSSYGDIWRPAIYGVIDSKEHYFHCVVGGNYWTQCIPYEGNEHLLGTTDDCDKFYKTWEKTGD